VTDTPPAKTSRGSLGAIFLTVFLDLVGFGMVIPLMPAFARRLHGSYFAATALFSAYSFFQLLFAPFWGRLSDRIGRRPVLIVSIAGGFVANLMFGVVGALWALFLARSLAGAAGANISTAQAYIADVTTPADRAKGMGMIGAAFGLGFVLGPAIGGIAVKYGSERTPFFVAAALGLVNLLYVVAVLPEPREQGQRSEARAFSFAGLRRTLSRPGLPGLILLFFTVTFAFSNLESTFPLWTSAEYHYGTHETSYLFVFIGFVLVIVQGAIVRRAAKKVGEPVLITTGTLLMAIGLGLLPLAGVDRGLVMLLPVLAVIATGNGLNSPAISAFISKQSDEHTQGEVLGVAQSASSLARILGPLFGGAMFGHVSIRAPYYAAAALMLVAALASLALPRSKPAASARPAE
jgi:multidrug resistance protein